MNTPSYHSILGNPPEPPVNTSEVQDKTELPYKNIPEWIEYGFSPIDKPTKENKPIGKPINGYDRLNALIRISEVQKELEVIEKESGKKKKFKLASVFFDKYRENPFLLMRPEVFDKYKHYSDLNTIHVFNNFEKSDLNFIPEYRDGRHIIIAVDTTKKNKDIMRNFEQILKRIRKDYKIPKTSDREFQQDIWRIYDMCSKYKTRPNYTAIARELSGKSGQARDNEQLSACLKAVKRANKRAIEIIKQVKQVDT